ncbi:MAG: UDP-N-acetylmuramate dehydrogenase [Acidobacteriota bacterium]|nr:UDP-N-acetylmuramate dehydrogenase [Acidobacteriota bacterium]MDE3261765.1 UDP-N-acetylmuramate dehydrogenase [Acidobacteriota bacterium]
MGSGPGPLPDGKRFRANHPLAPLTTLGLGGPADWFIEASGEEELLGALAAARRSGLPVTLLGGGSNVLVSDQGIRGAVIRVKGGGARQVDRRTVRAFAGVTVNGLVRWCIQRGFAGLEAWAGTPGTVGGAIHGNAHFGGREVGEVVTGLRFADDAARVESVRAEAVAFGPGGRALAGRGRVLLSADFGVQPEDPAVLRRRARASLAFRKRTQPLAAPSAGCAFRNPDPEEASLPPDVPCAAGALLDRAGMKGARVGGARVSEIHANFLTAAPGATAADVHELLGRCQAAVAAAFGVELAPEMILLGDFPS